MARKGNDWSGLASDLEKDQTVWLRVEDGKLDREEVLRVWQNTTRLTERLGGDFAHPRPPRQSPSGVIYQVAKLPQRRWSSLAYLMERREIGWDGASVLVEQLAEDLAQAEAAGLEPQGDIEHQILIDSSGEIMICGHWEQAVRADWAGGALLSILERLAGQEAETRQPVVQLRSRQVVGRLRSALTVAGALGAEEVSAARARKQIKAWLRDTPKRRRKWPWLLPPVIVGAIFLVSSLIPLPTRYVPDVKGASQSQAVTEIRKGGWQAKIKRVESSYRAGQVISQSPSAGSQLSEGSQITIRVASPRLDAEVPSLKGLDVATAKDLLAASGLRAKVFFVKQGPANQVQSTRPTAGSKLRSGETVTLVSAP